MPQKFRQNPRTAGRVIDGLASVVTPDDNKLHTLNKTGSRIWVLAENGCTLEEVAADLTRAYDVDPARATDDARRFCDDLVARGILEAVE